MALQIPAAARQVPAMKTLGTQIASAGFFSRELAMDALSGRDKDKLLSMLAQIASAGEKAAEVMPMGPLSKMMGHQEPEVCAAAVTAMGRMGSAGAHYADDIATYLLRHPDAKCRCTAVEALGHLGPLGKTGVHKAVAECLDDNDLSVRRSALLALGAMQAQDQAKAVGERLDDPAPKMRAAAIESLSLLISISQEVESMFPMDKMAAPLAGLLSDERTRQSALLATYFLGERAPEACVGAAVSALADSDGATRQAAAAAVGSLGSAVVKSTAAMDNLKACLRSKDVGARAAAAHAAAALGRPAAALAGAVADLLADDGEDDSGLAAQVGTSTRRAPPQMRRPKCAALTALGRMGDETYIKAIANCSADANWEVRMVAAEALASFGEAAKSEAATLASMLDDETFPVRATACIGLGEVRGMEALARLVEAFEDPAQSVRLHSVAAVGSMGEGAEEYCHDVFKLLNDDVSHVRGAAAIALSKLGATGQNYAGVVATMLYDEDADIRGSVVAALGGMGKSGEAYAEEIAERMHSDPSASVRLAAAEALAALGFGQQPALQAGPAGGFDGMGLHYADIQSKKAELQSSGKWIEGVL